MKFEKYQHVERLGTQETAGILDGLCYVFPKIDGTNSSVWMDGHELKAGSRNRELTLENDNAGFYAWVLQQDNIIEFFKVYPNVRLYGEWLVPHSLKTYSDDAWRDFYVFDVIDRDNKYIPYDIYLKTLEKYNIKTIPPICYIKNPTEEKLYELLEKNTYLIKDGQGVGEGIVIKNYNYRNKFGNIIWAKIVRNEFKQLNHGAFGIPEIKDRKQIEDEIINKYVTETLIEKEYSKIAIEGWTSKMIPRLLNTIYYCLITEETWNFLKEFKSPVVDFKRLANKCTLKIKELKPELF